MLVKELLTEASTARRGWDGKLKKVDALLAWMYDKDILTKGEKSKKDQVFRAYYRYYNDGDMPGTLKSQGFNKYSDPAKVEAALEKYLEDFMKTLLTKYLPKIDRTEFRLDKLISDLNTVISVATQHDAYGLLTYWLKTVKLSDPDGTLKQLVDTLNTQYAALKDEADAKHPASHNRVMSSRVDMLKDANVWSPKMQKAWDAAGETMDKIAEFLGNVKEAAKTMKRQKIVSTPV